MRTKFLKLPIEMYHEIMMFLNAKDVLNVFLLNKAYVKLQFNNNDIDNLYRDLIKRDCGPLDEHSGLTNQQKYISFFRSKVESNKWKKEFDFAYYISKATEPDMTKW